MKNTPQIEAFARRAIAGLPDSLSARHADLTVLTQILPLGCTGRSVAREMLVHLESQSQIQAEFAFSNTPTK